MIHQLIFCYTLALYLVGFQTVHLQRKYLTTYKFFNGGIHGFQRVHLNESDSLTFPPA